MGGILQIYWKLLYIILILLIVFLIPILALIKLKKADKSQWTAKEILDATLEKLKISNKVVYSDEFINDYIDKNSGDLHLNNKIANSKNLICVSKVYQLLIDNSKEIKRHILDHYFVLVELIIILLIFFGDYTHIAMVIIIVLLYILYYVLTKGGKNNSLYKNYINTVLASTNFTEKQKDAIQYLVYHRATLELYKIAYLIFSKK